MCKSIFKKKACVCNGVLFLNLICNDPLQIELCICIIAYPGKFRKLKKMEISCKLKTKMEILKNFLLIEDQNGNFLQIEDKIRNFGNLLKIYKLKIKMEICWKFKNWKKMEIWKFSWNIKILIFCWKLKK